MWRAHPWQDSPVNVNFGATSHEQSMSLPKLPMCDATRAGKVCRALGEPDSAGKGLGQVWGTPALHPHSWEGMGAMELPEWEWGLPLQLAHGYAGRCLHNPKQSFEEALSTAAVQMAVNREAAWHTTLGNSKDLPHGTMVSCNHPRDWVQLWPSEPAHQGHPTGEEAEEDHGTAWEL